MSERIHGKIMKKFKEILPRQTPAGIPGKTHKKTCNGILLKISSNVFSKKNLDLGEILGKLPKKIHGKTPGGILG